ncbi:MAG: hypothetical protein AB1611_03300 [bacterium]
MATRKIAGNFYLIISCQRSIIDIVKCLEAKASGKIPTAVAADFGYFFCQSNIEIDSLKNKPECPDIVRLGAARPLVVVTNTQAFSFGGHSH